MCIKYVKCKGNKLLVKQRTLLSKILDTKYLDCLICLERSNSISKIKNFMIVTYDNMYDYYGHINQQ